MHMVCITTFSQRHRGVCAKHAGSLINHKGLEWTVHLLRISEQGGLASLAQMGELARRLWLLRAGFHKLV